MNITSLLVQKGNKLFHLTLFDAQGNRVGDKIIFYDQRDIASVIFVVEAMLGCKFERKSDDGISSRYGKII